LDDGERLSRFVIGPLWLVGCGNLGRALLDGWLAAGVPPGSVTVINPSPRELPAGVAYASTPSRALALPAVVVLAVKPKQLAEVSVALMPHVEGALIVSVLAGAGLARLAAAFPRARVARALPNTPARIGQGVTLLAGDLSAADRATVEALGLALGTVHWVDEAELDVATAVASSSPAWVFRFVEALAEAGTAAGLTPTLAQTLAREAVAGAGAYAAKSSRSMDELAREVASPGGMTQAGLDVLDAEPGVRTLMREAVRAATLRAATLAKEANR